MKPLASRGSAMAVAAAALLYGIYAAWPTSIEEPAGQVATNESRPGDAGAKTSSIETTAPTADLESTWADGARFRLQGVIAGATADGAGVALIAIDGGTARAFRVGAVVDGKLALLGVSPGGAILGPPKGPPLVVLEVVMAATALSGAAQAGQASVTEPAGPVTSDQRLAATLPPATPDAGGAAPSISAGGDAPPLPATDLVQEHVATVHSPYIKPAPGRRVRLRPLNSSH